MCVENFVLNIAILHLRQPVLKMHFFCLILAIVQMNAAIE